MASVERAGKTVHDPCLLMWGECAVAPDFTHTCGRNEAEHEGRHRCAWCGATTLHIDPIFEDPEELERALDDD